MASEVSVRFKKTAGFTLLELLMVMTFIGLLISVAAWGSQKWIRNWRLQRAGQLLFEDLKRVQADAETAGSVTIRNGELLSRKTFLVFETDTRSYAAFSWQDDNADGFAESSETSLQWRNSLPRGISYGQSSDVNRRACSNANSPPNSAVSFSSPVAPPCNGRPCIKFDHYGFSMMGPGAVYLSDGQHSLAITATRPGHFTMCEWNGSRWH